MFGRGLYRPYVIKERLHLKLNLKVKINAHSKKKLEPNQNDALDHFLSAKRLHTRPPSYEATFILDWSTVGGTVQIKILATLGRGLRTCHWLGCGLYSPFLNYGRSLITFHSTMVPQISFLLTVQ